MNKKSSFGVSLFSCGDGWERADSERECASSFMHCFGGAQKREECRFKEEEFVGVTRGGGEVNTQKSSSSSSSSSSSFSQNPKQKQKKNPKLHFVVSKLSFDFVVVNSLVVYL